jgi:hypothetical protein
MESQILALLKKQLTYFKYQLVLQIPIGTWKYQLVCPIPRVTIHQEHQQEEQQSGYKSRASTTCSRARPEIC